MPDNDRISPLLSALSGGLSQEKLELLGREFNSLAQDRAETLVFFVLQNVCQRLASALEGEAVSVERFQALTAGIAALTVFCSLHPRVGSRNQPGT